MGFVAGGWRQFKRAVPRCINLLVVRSSTLKKHQLTLLKA